MLSTVNVQHLNNGVESYFLDRKCPVGYDYILVASASLKYILTQFNLSGTITSYISTKLGGIPVINVDIHEYMDEYTKKQTQETIGTFLQIAMSDFDQSDEFECMRLWNMEIPIIYSFFGKLHR